MSDDWMAPPPKARAFVGLLTGVIVASIFSAFALLVWLANGPGFEFLDATLGENVVNYYIWGPAVGVVVGLLFPITRRPLGAMTVGALVMTFGLLIFVAKPSATRGEYLFAIALGVGGGAIAGHLVFRRVWADLEKP